MDRSVPLIYRRAATAVAECRKHLDKAEREMALAIDILGRLDDPAAPLPRDPSERRALLESLQAFLARLHETREALLRTWIPADRYPVLTGRKELR